VSDFVLGSILVLNILLFISRVLIAAALLLEDTVNVVVGSAIGRSGPLRSSFLFLGLIEVHEVLLIIALGFSPFQIGTL